MFRGFLYFIKAFGTKNKTRCKISKKEAFMEFLTGVKTKETIEICDILTKEYERKKVKICGVIHTIRNFSKVTFIILRKMDGFIQCLKETAEKKTEEEEIKEGMIIEAYGTLYREERAPNGFELHLISLSILSKPAENAALPIQINKWKLNTSLETKLSLRSISLRNVREQAVFKIQEGIIRGFRDFLYQEHFTEIHTPKIVAGNAEGGANVFKLQYFGKKAFLTQSPQFYKQMMVGVYERVFETAPVFRAEKHNTARHLNEYTSLDFEMGYIKSFEEIMQMETAMLQFIFQFLEEEYKKEIQLLEIEIPCVSHIPQVRFDEAKRLIALKYNKMIKNPYDLEPEEEILIGQYFKEEYQSDFVFVTHYPSKKRPFYTMDEKENKIFTLSFDLLFKGMEVTTGGQRIHSYKEQVEKMLKRGMNIDDFESYLMIHKYGIPPHGGLGIGLERLTMKLLDAANIRETTMFPRDVCRLEP